MARPVRAFRWNALLLIALLISSNLLLVYSRQVSAETLPSALAEWPKETVYLDILPLSQNPELPNGCEITSLATVLNYWGYPVDKVTLSDEFLDKQEFVIRGGVKYGGNPEEVYVGNPKSKEGFYCYQVPIVRAANRYLESVGADERAYDITGAGLEEIKSHLDQGRPVIVWSVRDGKDRELKYSDKSWLFSETGEFYRPYSNLHCFLVQGYGPDKIFLTDTLEEDIISRSYDYFFPPFEKMGSRAVVIY